MRTKEFSVWQDEDKQWYVLVRDPYRKWEAIPVSFASEALAELAMKGMAAALVADGGEARFFKARPKFKVA